MARYARSQYVKRTLEDVMEKAFAESTIRLIIHLDTRGCIPEVDDVLHLLCLIDPPAKYRERMLRSQIYARNTALVAASVADELLHCEGCRHDLDAVRATIARAIAALMPEPVQRPPSEAIERKRQDFCCTDH